LERLEQAAWFSRLGVKNTTEVVVLSSWPKEIEQCSSLAWEHLQLEAANRYRERLVKLSKARFTEWNDIAAEMQAVAKGIANDAQQQRAYDYVVRVLCETDRMTFWPGGEDGKRATDFAEGKRWVGVQLRRIEKMRPDHRDRMSEGT
jgi:hypothetical protein